MRSAAARISSTSWRATPVSSGATQQERRRAENDRHLVVGLVRDATGELAHDFEPLALARTLLDLAAGRLVGIDLHHAKRPAFDILPQYPLRGDEHARAALGVVNELAFPPAARRQHLFDLVERKRKLRPEQFVGDLSERLLRRPPVQPLRASAPIGDPSAPIPHQDLRQVEGLCQLPAARGLGGEQALRTALAR